MPWPLPFVHIITKYLQANCVFFFFSHSAHALTSDVSIEEMARAAEFFLSDGVIITGVATGAQADPQELTSILPFFKLHIDPSQK